MASRVPSTAWYRLAFWVVVAGVVSAIVWFLYALVIQTDAVNDFVGVPGVPQATVVVTEAGEHTVWAGAGCGGACRPESAATYRRHLDLHFEAADGAPAPVVPATEQYFNVGGGREGRAVWLVDFEEPGTWTTRLSSDGEVPQPRLWFGQGRGLPARFARGSVLIVVGSVAAAATIATVTALARRWALARLPPVVLQSGGGRRG